jgi:hypothetical protein
MDLVDPAAFRAPFDAWLRALKRGERRGADPADEFGHQVWQLLSVERFLRQHGRLERHGTENTPMD